MLNTRIPIDDVPIYLRLNIRGRKSWFEWSYDHLKYDKIGLCGRVKHQHYADFDFFEYVADGDKNVE